MTGAGKKSEAGPLLLAVAAFPPSVSGSAILNRNLWSAWPAEDLVVVAADLKELRTDPSLALPNIRTEVIDPRLFKTGRLALHLDPLNAWSVANSLVRIAKEVRPRAIWANWPTTPFAIGAWMAARRLRLPFYFHLHDLWKEGYAGKRLYVERLAAAYYEARILRTARRIFTITDAAREFYLQTRNVDSYVLPHSLPVADLSDQSETVISPEGPRLLHFAGAIYPLMNQDAIVNVVKALDRCKHEIVFDCFTAGSAEQMAGIGIGGPQVRIGFVPKAEVMKRQRSSDLLLLPLAFHSSNPHEIQTVFPTKLLEYYVSGRPILVHAPADSWASRSAREAGWGEVVDSTDPENLAKAIDALLENPQRQQSLVAAARKEAERRAAPLVAQRLREELQRLEGQFERTG